MSYALMVDKQELLYNHNVLLHEKNSCNLTFLEIVRILMKRVHFFGLYMLYEKVDLTELKVNENL